MRTKSVGAPRFNPGSYHNGSVWPMDTGIIADGLRQHGYSKEADDLEDREPHAEPRGDRRPGGSGDGSRDQCEDRGEKPEPRKDGSGLWNPVKDSFPSAISTLA